jgi:hypothetical protein
MGEAEIVPNLGTERLIIWGDCDYPRAAAVEDVLLFAEACGYECFESGKVASWEQENARLSALNEKLAKELELAKESYDVVCEPW